MSYLALATAPRRTNDRLFTRMTKAELEIDEDMTEAMADLCTDLSMYESDDGSPALYTMERYTIDRNSGCFRKSERGVDTADQEKVECITGVLMCAQTFRLKRENPMFTPGQDNHIVCQSPDKRLGIGDPGGNCQTCEFQNWELAKAQGKKHPDPNLSLIHI